MKRILALMTVLLVLSAPNAYSLAVFYAIDVEDFDIVSRNYFDDPSEAEGSPDGNYVALGGGYIIATMEKWFENGTGADILVCEIGSTIDSGETDEPFDVHISSDKVNWIKVADNIINDSGKPYASIDITGNNGSYKFVKVTDRTSDLGYGLAPGSDIDAIGAKYEGEETTTTTTPADLTTTTINGCTYGSCITTFECKAALGVGWSCVNGCCEQRGFTCPILSALEDDESQLETIRRFRDEMLSQTSVGQEIIRLYYLWSPVIVKAMEEDEEFKEDVKEMIDGVLELIGGEIE